MKEPFSQNPSDYWSGLDCIPSWQRVLWIGLSVRGKMRRQGFISLYAFCTALVLFGFALDKYSFLISWDLWDFLYRTNLASVVTIWITFFLTTAALIKRARSAGWIPWIGSLPLIAMLLGIAVGIAPHQYWGITNFAPSGILMISAVAAFVIISALLLFIPAKENTQQQSVGTNLAIRPGTDLVPRRASPKHQEQRLIEKRN